MKTKLFITIIVSVSLSVLICYVFLTEVNIPYYSFCEKDDIIDLLGTIVSCFSILLTGFFAILAVDAYGKIEAIKRDANDAKQYRENAKQYSEDACLRLKKIGDVSIATYEYAINLIEKLRQNSNRDQKTKERYRKWREETYRNLYSLGLNPLLLDEGKRVDFIKKLSSFAGEEEIKILKEILNSNESKEIKDAASLVIKQIEERGNVSGNCSLI